MKPKSTFLTLVFGLVVTLFACQDQSVVAPDDVISPDDLVAAFGKPWCSPWPSCRNDPPPPPSGDPTLELSWPEDADGVLDGFSSTDVTWKSKKGIFSMHAPFDPKIKYIGGALDGCNAVGSNGDALLEAFLNPDMGGKLANIFFDEDENGLVSADHRIFVLVEGEILRYFWIGPRYAVGSLFPSDATFTREVQSDGSIQFTLTGGVIGMRDTGSPNSHTQVACPYTGSVTVTLTK